MKAFFKTLLLGGMFIFMVASPVMAVTSPQTVSAAGCEGRVLGVPPWYRGLTNENPPECSMKTPDDVGGLSAFIWMIVLNGIDMALVLAVYAAIFFIMFGGFLYLTGGAVPAQTERARKTIFNAVIGLVICLGAIAIVNLIFSMIT